MSRVKCRIRRDDTVLVIAGKDKGTRGRVLRVLPEDSRVVVEGVNRIKRHQKPCLLYTSPSPRDATLSRMPSSA